MQNTSDLYRALLADPDARYETVALIGGEEYYEDRIVSLRTYGGLFYGDEPGIGGVCARRIDLVIRDYGEIPRNAPMVAGVRLTNGAESSEWLSKGIYYIDTREPDDEAGTLRLHGFDPSLLPDLYTFGSVSELIGIPAVENYELKVPVSDFVRAILAGFGGVDERTVLTDERVGVKVPSRSTLKDFLGWVAAEHGGNWTVTDAGKWLLVPLPVTYAPTLLADYDGAVLTVGGVALQVQDGYGKTSGYIDVGRAAQSVSTPPAFKPISRVTLTVDDGDTVYTAGDDTGYALTAACQIATQETADALLALLGGYQYQPMTAAGAILDPAAELGDVAVVNGTAALIASMDVTFDGLMAATVSAPGTSETDSEYPRAASSGAAAAQSKTLNKSKDYTDKVAANGLAVRIVSALPEDHASQNVIWVIPGED